MTKFRSLVASLAIATTAIIGFAGAANASDVAGSVNAQHLWCCR